MSETSFDAWEVKTFVGSFFAIVLISFLLVSSGAIADEVGEPPQLDQNETGIDLNTSDFPEQPEEVETGRTVKYDTEGFEVTLPAPQNFGEYFGDEFIYGGEISLEDQNHYFFYAPSKALSTDLDQGLVLFMVPKDRIADHQPEVEDPTNYSFTNYAVDYGEDGEIDKALTNYLNETGESKRVFYFNTSDPPTYGDGGLIDDIVFDSAEGGGLNTEDGKFYINIQSFNEGDGGPYGSFQYDSDTPSVFPDFTDIPGIGYLAFFVSIFLWGLNFIMTIIIDVVRTLGVLGAYIFGLFWYVIKGWLNIGALIPGVLGLLFQGFTMVLFLLLFNGVSKIVKMLPTT